MVVTGDILDTEQTKDYGLVSHIVPHDRFTPETRSLATKIAAGPPIAMKLATAILAGLR